MVLKVKLFISLLVVTMNLGCKTFEQGSSDFQAIDVEMKHPNDRRLQRAITLDNELSVLLISDPDLNKSAAAMDVAVGSLEDPKEHLGLAHFLEHMLFLGTKKYPVVDEYNQYLTSYQGSSNAYTAGEHTNYFFEINHDGFEGGLDRFAQFFVSPLFNAEYVERERNAVDSEHQKNLKDDSWRVHVVLRALHRNDHPRRKFSTGDHETLKNADRKTLIDFYQKYYSADVMKLVVMSKYSLDQLESWVREMFRAVPNHHRGSLVYDKDLFDDTELPRLITVKSIKNIKRLSLAFEIPGQDSYWQSKPASLLAHFIGYEGEGSLLSLLKKEQLVTSLSSSVENASFAGLFQVDMSLTDEGFKRPERIIELFFSYIKLLKKEGLKHYLYDERKMMADLNYVYREPKEGGYVASQYASRMQVHPALLIDKNDHLYHSYNEKDYLQLLDQLTVAKLNAILMGEEVAADLVEPHYTTHYGIKKFSAADQTSFANAPLHPELFLPKPNEFIPKHLTLESSKVSTQPKKIIDNKWGTFWYQQDDTFHLPKAIVRLVLLSDKVNSSPKQKALSFLYQMAISESHNEWNYDISLAGLNYTIARTDRGIQLDFSGYSENLSSLMRAVAGKLKEIKIDENTLEVIKTDFKRSIANAYYDAAYTQAVYELRYFMTKELIHRKDLFNPEAEIDVISEITLKELKDYAEELYNEIAIEGLVYGSIAEQEVKDVVDYYPKKLAANVLALEKRKNTEVLKMSSGQRLAVVLSTKTNNNCYAMNVQFGQRSMPLNAAIRIGVAHLQNRFFTELRTKQQLGYIVHAGSDFQEKVLGMLFLIQSSSFAPKELATRVKAFFNLAIQELQNMPSEQFESYRQAVIHELNEKDKTMYDKHRMLFSEAYMYEETFNYRQHIAEAAAKITQKDVIEIFKQAFDTKGLASMSIYMTQAGSQLETPEESLIEDDMKFKHAMSVY